MLEIFLCQNLSPIRIFPSTQHNHTISNRRFSDSISSFFIRSFKTPAKMQSIRRIAFRSAVSASRTLTSTTRATPFANQITRSANVAKPLSIITARFFTQTGRFANEEKAAENTEVKAEDAQPTEAVERTEAGSSEFTLGQPTPHGIFVRNLIFDATEEHIKALFEKFGGINHVVIARDSGGLSKGYGFVFFTSKEGQLEAVRNVDGTFWHGRRLQVAERTGTDKRRERPDSPNGPTESLYIGNIPYETTDAELNVLFRDLDGVADVRVAVDRTTGWPRGFAHVDFHDIEASKDAHAKLQNLVIGQRKLIVDFAGQKGHRVSKMDGGNRGDRGEGSRSSY